jgi:hypothetical protein
MTLVSGKGILNVCDALIATLRSDLPAAVSAANAAHSARFITPLAASYVLAADKTLILHKDNGAAVTGTIGSGTYTAAQLVTAINAVGALAAVWTARAIMQSTRVEMYDSTRGVAGNVIIGAGTINSILGLVEGTVYNYIPLVDIQRYSARQEEIDAMVGAYPALVVRADQIFPDMNTTGEMIEYEARMRLYDIYEASSGGNVDLLYHRLAHMAELIVDTLTDGDNASLDGQANGTTFAAVRISDTIAAPGEGPLFLGWADFELTVKVQEELY